MNRLHILRVFSLVVVRIFLSGMSLQAQNNLVNVIPPSPTATSMQQYGNTDVSLYTGAVRTNIPIHTIKLKELQFSINLNYSGSGGINVQEVASWIGLGWSLNATGAVSRTIYGLADDRYNSGYLYTPAIPPAIPENINTYLDFAAGTADSEPDKYYYSINGVSGSFYINKQKQVIQVPLTNNKVVPEFDQLGKIIEFSLITDRGIVYRFSEFEEVRSYGLTGNSSDNNYYISSWYLTSVRNHNDTEAINFHYEAYDFDRTSEFYTTRILDNPGNVFMPRYSVTETNAKRLKYITYNQADTVKFIVGALARRDLYGEKFLATIEIKEQEMTSYVDFSYSYFDNGGVVPITSTDSCSGTYAEISYINASTDGDNCKRLKLDSVTFFNNNRTESLSYAFEYYSEAYLPHRFSYARDHWGFYNGQDNNPGLEPRRKIDRRPIDDTLRGNIDFEIQGNANREPSAVHAKAGVLTKIIYPTGGSTSYEYELHQSSLNLLPNQKQAFNVDLSPNILKDTIHLKTINDPFIDVRVTVLGIPLSEYCDFTVIFKDINQTGEAESLIGFNEGEPWMGGLSKTIYLESGDYEISFVAHNWRGNCFEDFYNLGFTWQNEVPTANKDVGGLRIKQTTDLSGLGDSVVRVYSYTLPDSVTSSGSLVSIPRYGHYESGYNKGSTQDKVLSFIRMYNTNTPLTLTQGSHVGYRRVEVTTAHPQITGKSVFHYTSPFDFPDFTRGWEAEKYDDEITLGNGNTEYTYVFPNHDNRDWKRGLLYAQVDYSFQNDEFVRVASKENYYKIYAELNSDFDEDWQDKYPLQFLSLEPEYNKDEFFSYEWIYGENLPKLLGVRVLPAYDEQGAIGLDYIKNYEYYTGRLELVSQTERTFKGGQSLITGTSYFFGNSLYYYPTKIQTSTSQSDSITTIVRYPFDGNSLTNLASVNRVALDSLVARNMIAEPIEKTISKAGVEVDRQRTDFVLNGSAVLPDKISKASNGNPLEEEVRFLEYNAEGRLLEYKGKDDLGTSIIWGYNNQYPVAQAINATSDNIYFTSFEETGTQETVSNPARTGNRYLNSGSYTFSTNGFVPGSTTNLMMSYWYWNSNKWIFSGVVTWSNSINAGTRLDEIRVFPGDAQMTTYTYRPGLGISSMTDANNVSNRYEYDSFGRLQVVRDQDGNILKTYKYHYKEN